MHKILVLVYDGDQQYLVNNQVGYLPDGSNLHTFSVIIVYTEENMLFLI
jgi:hypothetical protein